jgi:hypothetical protein
MSCKLHVTHTFYFVVTWGSGVLVSHPSRLNEPGVHCFCCRAVTWGYAITAAICTVLGGFGYALYGSSTAPVITASLPPLSLVALLCTCLTLCNPFSAFALTLEPVALAVQQQLRGGQSTPYPLRAVIRLGERLL